MSIISAASATELVSHPVIKVEFLSLIGGPPACYNQINLSHNNLGNHQTTTIRIKFQAVAILIACQATFFNCYWDN